MNPGAPGEGALEHGWYSIGFGNVVHGSKKHVFGPCNAFKEADAWPILEAAVSLSLATNRG